MQVNKFGSMIPRIKLLIMIKLNKKSNYNKNVKRKREKRTKKI